MNCNECQQPITEQQKTCLNCGAPVEAQPTVRDTEATALRAPVSASLQDPVPHPDMNRDGKQVSLWTPWLIVLWFLPFLGTLVASFLIAFNWWNLQKRHLAIWALAFIPLVMVALSWLLPDNTPYLTYCLGSFSAWFIVVAAPQIWFVQKHYGTGYDRRRWLVPIGLGLIFQFAIPRIVGYLESPSEAVAPQPSEQLTSVAQNQQVAKELTVEEVVRAKSDLVVPLEVSWTETSLLIFSSKETRSGSAVVIGAKDNLVLFATNRHVVKVPDGADDIKRILVDGKNRLPFTLVTELTDELDLAVIQISLPDALKPFGISMAALTEIAVGEECVAIGNALGHGISVTTGIVSRLDANRDGSHFMIRTSAPISPGNSGGGLFRRKDGKLLGITTASRIDEGAQNVNFALPIEYVWKLKLLEPSTK